MLAKCRQDVNIVESNLLGKQMAMENIMAEQTALRQQVERALQEQGKLTEAKREEAQRQLHIRADELNGAELHTQQQLELLAIAQQQRAAFVKQENEQTHVW